MKWWAGSLNLLDKGGEIPNNSLSIVNMSKVPSVIMVVVSEKLSKFDGT